MRTALTSLAATATASRRPVSTSTPSTRRETTATRVTWDAASQRVRLQIVVEGHHDQRHVVRLHKIAHDVVLHACVAAPWSRDRATFKVNEDADSAPQSMATIVGLSPPWLYVRIDLVDTSATKFLRFGSTKPTSLGGEGGAPSTSSRPRIEPLSLNPFVSALVSTPKMAGTPACAASKGQVVLQFGVCRGRSEVLLSR